MEMPPMQRPIPRRTFEITPASSDSSMPPSPAPESQNSELLTADRHEQALSPSRTRSILNLTSSTLLGIYSGATDGGSRQELNTPWGTGAQTPNLSQRPSVDVDRLTIPSFPFKSSHSSAMPSRRFIRKGFRAYYIPLITQTVMLFGFGMGFGALATHLHKTQQISAVPVPTNSVNSKYFQIAWGIMGVVLGNALPQIDLLFDDEEEVLADGWDNKTPQYQHLRTLSGTSQSGKERPSLADSGLGPIWHSAVRSIGAFVGIAFALRKVPWQSTLQVSSTLAIVNPLLWYLIDRSKPGFALALLVSITGTLVSLLVNPQFVPLPGIHQEQASEKLGVFLWLASILFCTSLCFGAIGRRLQL